jgi:hypothetical protein
MTRPSRDGYRCPVCLDFDVLPGIGPCPACRPAAYVDFILAVLDRVDAARSAPADTADADADCGSAGGAAA